MKKVLILTIGLGLSASSYAKTIIRPCAKVVQNQSILKGTCSITDTTLGRVVKSKTVGKYIIEDNINGKKVSYSMTDRGKYVEHYYLDPNGNGVRVDYLYKDL